MADGTPARFSIDSSFIDVLSADEMRERARFLLGDPSELARSVIAILHVVFLVVIAFRRSPN